MAGEPRYFYGFSHKVGNLHYYKGNLIFAVEYLGSTAKISTITSKLLFIWEL